MPSKANRARVERALNEARYLYEQQSEADRELLRQAFVAGQQPIQEVQASFAALPENPCHTCGRCCTNAGADSGYYGHPERMMLLEQGVDLRDYFAADYEGQSEQRCLFLSQQGCNIPAAYRSNACLGYVCYDRLAPALATAGQEHNFVSAAGLLRQTRRRLQPLADIKFPRQQLNFGNG